MMNLIVKEASYSFTGDPASIALVLLDLVCLLHFLLVLRTVRDLKVPNRLHLENVHVDPKIIEIEDAGLTRRTLFEGDFRNDRLEWMRILG